MRVIRILMVGALLTVSLSMTAANVTAEGTDILDIAEASSSGCTTAYVNAINGGWYDGDRKIGAEGCEPDPFESKVKWHDDVSGKSGSCKTESGVGCTDTSITSENCADVYAYLYRWNGETKTDWKYRCTDDGSGGDGGDDDSTTNSRYTST